LRVPLASALGSALETRSLTERVCIPWRCEHGHIEEGEVGIERWVVSCGGLVLFVVFVVAKQS
jgi:hypothetical protein